MSEVMDIGAMGQVVQAYDAHQELLADGDRELQAQKAELAGMEERIARARAYEVALDTHVTELEEALARGRGELVAADRDADVVAGFHWENRVALKDIIFELWRRLEGKSSVNPTLLPPGLAKRWFAEDAARAKALYDRLWPPVQGGGA